MDKWARFLFNEKLDPKRTDEASVMELIYLCEELSKKRGPLIRPHSEKLISRRLVVNTALDLGIDLLDIKDRWSGKIMIGRGLLDIWSVEYEKRYGSTYGTLGAWEIKRRNVKTRLSQRFHKE